MTLTRTTWPLRIMMILSSSKTWQVYEQESDKRTSYGASSTVNRGSDAFGSLSRPPVQLQMPSGPPPPLSHTERPNRGDTGDQSTVNPSIDVVNFGTCPPTQMQVTLDPQPPLSHTALPESVTAVVSESSPSLGNVLLGKTASTPVSPPPFDQRSSANTILSRTPATSRTQLLAIPAESRSSDSSKETDISLAGGTSHTLLPDSFRTSELTLPDSGEALQLPNIPSPLQRSIGLERVESSRSATRHSSVTKATSASIRLTTPIPPRRAPITEGSSPSGVPDAPVGRSPERRKTFSVTRPNIKTSNPENDFSVQSLSGGGVPKFSFNSLSDNSDFSSQSGGSDDTVSSEESEAALLAQNSAEEQEFRAARQQLAGVNLRPPKSWGPGMARFR
ncbi:hypothetical protein DFH94DRAFT_748616 [Russula ochroleuca]|uniref:Uncharacterized protein n=1 Tax=Russula ochroleuca TaxID=152965 RepID=A0A9P5T8F1_9AGAM|nr:hypothetical protein DFH94DRAFT_748616 [Russula ochroleuca]